MYDYLKCEGAYVKDHQSGRVFSGDWIKGAVTQSGVGDGDGLRDGVWMSRPRVFMVEKCFN